MLNEEYEQRKMDKKIVDELNRLGLKMDVNTLYGIILGLQRKVQALEDLLKAKGISLNQEDEEEDVKSDGWWGEEKG
jgi:hypothetical protein